MKDCLEQHRNEDDFPAECKEEVEGMMAERSTDFRLDPALREACREDILLTCGWDDVSTLTALYNSRHAMVCTLHSLLHLQICCARQLPFGCDLIHQQLGLSKHNAMQRSLRFGRICAHFHESCQSINSSHGTLFCHTHGGLSTDSSKPLKASRLGEATRLASG